MAKGPWNSHETSLRLPWDHQGTSSDSVVSGSHETLMEQSLLAHDMLAHILASKSWSSVGHKGIQKVGQIPSHQPEVETEVPEMSTEFSNLWSYIYWSPLVRVSCYDTRVTIRNDDYTLGVTICHALTAFRQDTASESLKRRSGHGISWSFKILYEVPLALGKDEHTRLVGYSSDQE